MSPAIEAPIAQRRNRVLVRFFRNGSARVSLALLVFISLVAIFAPVISPYNPTTANFELLTKSPSPQHWFGTDELGRDVLSRVIWGARVSLTAGLVSVALALVVGTLMGLLSGYFGGRLDAIFMRLVDAMLALPFLVLAIVLAAILGPSLRNAMLAIAIVSVPSFARIVRGEVLAHKEREYVQAAQAIGASHSRIMFRHLLVNVVSALVVQVTLSIATAIIAESSLSFLGLGVQPPTPSWGSMLDSARAYLTTAPYLAIFPGLAIYLTVLSFNMLGDALSAALNPRSPA